DVRVSRVHAARLREAGVIDDGELAELLGGLDAVAAELESGEFQVTDGDEDIHMAIERRLTELAGPVGGKLHTARSRNDQVATDVALYARERCARAIELIAALMARLDYLAAAAICATHLSRLGSEIVLWSSEEFGFCQPDDEFSSGSSIMPQKKNPDAAELLRAKAPRVAAGLATVLGVLHALPLAYSK